MAWTNKIKNIIKQKITSNLMSGLTSAATGQPKKLAAKLANKSPLDMSKSPVAHMEAINNPFTYGSVYYPQETSTLSEGHYIIFESGFLKYQPQQDSMFDQSISVGGTGIGPVAPQENITG